MTSVLETRIDTFTLNPDTGEITSKTGEAMASKTFKTDVGITDQFIKVSKYLNTIFAYQGIPLTLVPISLIFAQRMEFKTNVLYLLKVDKTEISKMLGCSLKHTEALILKCKKYDIIRPIARGKYEVNSFLFSTGTLTETRKLQAHFDIENDYFEASAEQTNRITGEVVTKAVKNRDKNQIPGQMTLPELEYSHEKEERHEQA